VDIDVPLFLPLYGQRRQHDLRRIALREARENFRIDGQMNFDSGWEWGYWLSDMVTARASWQPHLYVANATEDDTASGKGDATQQCATVTGDDSADTAAKGTFVSCFRCSIPHALTKFLFMLTECVDGARFPPAYEAAQDQWVAFSLALQPYTNLYGPEFGARLNAFLVELSQVQAEVLVRGRVKGVDCPDLKKLTGMAYLSGGDTWVDIPRLFGLAFTQPDKVHIREAHDPLWPHALALLQEMATLFSALAERMDALYADILAHAQEVEIQAHDRGGEVYHINSQALQFLSEIRDGTNMLAMRAQQAYLLYQSRDSVIGAEEAVRKELQRQARSVVHRAEEVSLL
jgi:hypothetical protein